MLNQLALFFKICGYLMAAFSILFIVHLGFGIAMVTNPSAFESKNPNSSTMPPGFGWLFLFAGLFAVGVGQLVGWSCVAASTWIKNREHYRRILILSGIICLWTPLGTLLGVYSLANLTKPEFKELFPPPYF